MPRYQLRVSKEENLENLVDAMAQHAWYTARQYFDLRKLQPQDFDDFRDETRRSLRPFLSGYDLCGLAFECSDEVEGAPWLNHEENIYHLHIPDTFSDFVEQVSNAAFHTIKHLANPGQSTSVYEAIEHAFRRRLSDRLYYNPACGRIDICNASRPVNPWKH